MRTHDLTSDDPAPADLQARQDAARGIEYNQEPPPGITTDLMRALGVDPSAVSPYSGTSKAIERAFRNFFTRKPAVRP
jgi:hypothetical protein